MPGPQDAADYVSTTSDFVPVDWIPITPGVAHRELRGLRANTAGTVSVRTAGSDADFRTLNFLAGETRWGMFLEVQATGTTATGLEGAV